MPTPADLVDALEYATSQHLNDAGKFLDVLGDATRTRTLAIEEGLRRGLRDVGRAPLASSGPLDPLDTATLSPFEEQRVKDVAELHVWNRVLQWWPAVARSEGVPAYGPDGDSTVRGGWRWQDYLAIKDRRDELARDLAAPYREPGPALVVNPPTQTSGPVRGPYFYRGGTYWC